MLSLPPLFMARNCFLPLAGLSGINQVLHFVGSEILLHLDQLPAPEDGEYYWHDLIGLNVVQLMAVSRLGFWRA